MLNLVQKQYIQNKSLSFKIASFDYLNIQFKEPEISVIHAVLSRLSSGENSRLLKIKSDTKVLLQFQSQLTNLIAALCITLTLLPCASAIKVVRNLLKQTFDLCKFFYTKIMFPCFFKDFEIV